MATMPASSVRRPSDEYQDIRWIGSGQHGDVYKCVHLPTGRMVARKSIFYYSSTALSQITRELSVLSRSSDCQFVLKLETFWIDEDRVSLVLEYCKQGSLLDWIKARGPLNETQLATVAWVVVNALIYMRDKFKLCHRDLKPANILINGAGAIKVADFGEAGALRHVGVGSMGYKSPECLDAQNLTVDPEKADVWSLGILLVELATGAFPFEALTEIELWEAIHHDASPSLPNRFSASARHFVEECMRKDPMRRGSLNYLVDHPFLKKSSPTAFSRSSSGEDRGE